MLGQVVAFRPGSAATDLVPPVQRATNLRHRQLEDESCSGGRAVRRPHQLVNPRISVGSIAR